MKRIIKNRAFRRAVMWSGLFNFCLVLLVIGFVTCMDSLWQAQKGISFYSEIMNILSKWLN